MITNLRKFADVTPLYKASDTPAKTSWVRVLTSGPMVYKGKDIEYTDEDLVTIAAETNRLIHNSKRYAELADTKAQEDGIDVRATPWLPPFLREHGKGNDGETKGSKVLKARATGSNLWALVDWSDEEHALVLSEQLEYVSPAIRSGYVDQGGQRYEAVLWEVSATTHPKRRDIGRIQDTLEVRLSDNTYTVNLADYDDMELADMEDLLNQILASLDALNARLDAMEGVEANEDGDEEDPEMSDGDQGEAPEPAAEDAPEPVAASDADEDEKIAKFAEAFEARFDRLEGVVVSLAESRGTFITEEPGNGGKVQRRRPTELTEDRLRELEEKYGHEEAMRRSFELYG